MSKEQFNQGIGLGREHHAHILKRGSKWKNRHIPIFIRENLMVPYYITQNGAYLELWIISYPIGVNDKVSFVRFATASYEASEIYVGPKSPG